MQTENSKVNNSKENRSPIEKVYLRILFLFFGIGTWLNLNGIWIELPLLVPRLPEGWALSAQLGMASNLANVGPLVIALIRSIVGKSSAYEVPSIIVIFVVGIVFPLVLSFTWDQTFYVFGQQRSVYLLLFGFFLALVNCTSSVTYLPFLNRFDKKMLNVYFAGESLSSLIPALLGLVQGVGEETECVKKEANSTELIPKLHSPRFSVDIYLICLSVLMVLSLVSFLLLWRYEKNKRKNEKTTQNENCNVNADPLLGIDVTNQMIEENVPDTKRFSNEELFHLFLVFLTSFLLFGCIPSINSYSLNPYGAKTFHYVIILCQCCYPVVALISNILPRLFAVSNMKLIVSTISGICVFIYIFFTAYFSPCSPFIDQMFGKWLIGFLWLLIYVIFYSERIAIGNHLNHTNGHRGLFWYGLLTQIGAFGGALLLFILTSCNVFEEREFCKNYKCSSIFA